MGESDTEGQRHRARDCASGDLTRSQAPHRRVTVEHVVPAAVKRCLALCCARPLARWERAGLRGGVAPALGGGCHKALSHLQPSASIHLTCGLTTAPLAAALAPSLNPYHPSGERITRAQAPISAMLPLSRHPCQPAGLAFLPCSMAPAALPSTWPCPTSRVVGAMPPCLTWALPYPSHGPRPPPPAC